MADVIDSKGGDKLLPPRMQRSGGQRFLLEDGELIQQSATTVTTGESSSKQDNKNKGFLSKLQTFKLKFDQLDQERASRHIVQQSIQQQPVQQSVQLSQSDSLNDNIHRMQLELLKKMHTKIDQMDPSHQLQLQHNKLLEKTMGRILQENEQLRVKSKKQEMNQQKFDAIMPEIDELISSVAHLQVENEKLHEKNVNITLLLEQMTDKVVKVDQKLKKKKEEVAKLKSENKVLLKEVKLLKGGGTSSGMVSQHNIGHHHFHQAERDLFHQAEPPISQRNMNGTVVPLPFGELELNSSTERGPRQPTGVPPRQRSRSSDCPSTPSRLPRQRSRSNSCNDAFRLIDKNGDGFLQKEEVVRAIEMMCDHGEMDLGGLTSLDAAEKMMLEVDVDGDGQIDIDEFNLYMEKSSSAGRGEVSRPLPRQRSRSNSCNGRVRFKSENNGFQLTTPPVQTRSKSVLRTPKYKVCEELMKQQLDESEKVTTMSMDISLNSVHCDDDAEEEEIRSSKVNHLVVRRSYQADQAVCSHPTTEENVLDNINSSTPRTNSLKEQSSNTNHHTKLDSIDGSCDITADRSSDNKKADLRVASTETFRLIDENGDGFLQKEEVVRAIEMMCDHGEMDLGGLTSLDAAEKMMHEVDIDGDGQIDMDEFALLWDMDEFMI